MKITNCPCCGGAMKPGRFSNMDEVFWHPDGEKPPRLRDLLSWEGIKELCSDGPSGCIEIPDPEEGWFPIIDSVRAYHCPCCKIFIFEGREG